MRRKSGALSYTIVGGKYVGFHNEVPGPEIQKLYDIVDTLEPSPSARTAIARIHVAGFAAKARVDSENVAI